MQDWLVSHSIVYPEKALKRELYQLIKFSNIDHKYTVYQMAKASGHEVVRLPQYYCELNPIELAWSRVKSRGVPGPGPTRAWALASKFNDNYIHLLSIIIHSW